MPTDRLEALRERFEAAGYDSPSLDAVVCHRSGVRGAEASAMAGLLCRLFHDEGCTTCNLGGAIAALTRLAPQDRGQLTTWQHPLTAGKDWKCKLFAGDGEGSKASPLFEELAHDAATHLLNASGDRKDRMSRWLIYLADRDEPLDASASRQTLKYHVDAWRGVPNPQGVKEQYLLQRGVPVRTHGAPWPPQWVPFSNHQPHREIWPPDAKPEACTWWVVRLNNVFRLSREAIERTVAPFGVAITREAMAKRKGKAIDGAMLKMLADDQLLYDWSARQFAERLDCQKSTVLATKAWKQVMLARAARAAERLTGTGAFNGGNKRRARP